MSAPEELDDWQEMTVRDFIAATAAPAIITNFVDTPEPGWAAYAAWKAYEFADAMLRTRTKEITPDA